MSTAIVPVDESGQEVPQEQVLAVRERQAPLTVRSLMSGAKLEEIKKVCARGANAEKMLKMFAIASSRVPKLLECTPLSMLDAMVRCAELGLMPSTLGTAYLIPYENRRAGTVECQLIIGYRGLVELARRSGQISTIQAGVVREGDLFDFSYGVETTFKHVPKGNFKSRITHVWALAKFVAGGHQLEVMTIDEVEAIRSRSRAGQNGPWVSDYGEMCKKTALRRLCKMLPLTPEVEAGLEQIEKGEFNLDLPANPQQERPENDAPAPSKNDQMADKLGVGKKTETPSAPAKDDQGPAPVAGDAHEKPAPGNGQAATTTASMSPEEFEASLTGEPAKPAPTTVRRTTRR